VAELDPRWECWHAFLTAALQECEAQRQQAAAGRSLCRLDVPAREPAALKQLEGCYTSYRDLARETLGGEPLSRAELAAAVARQAVVGRLAGAGRARFLAIARPSPGKPTAKAAAALPRQRPPGCSATREIDG